MIKNTEMKLEILRSIIPILEKHLNTKIDLGGLYTFREDLDYDKEIYFEIDNTSFESKCFTEDGEIRIDKFIEEALKRLKEDKEKERFIQMIYFIIEDRYNCKICSLQDCIGSEESFININFTDKKSMKRSIRIDYNKISNMDLEKLIIKIKKEIE